MGLEVKLNVDQCSPILKFLNLMSFVYRKLIVWILTLKHSKKNGMVQFSMLLAQYMAGDC